MIALFQQVFAKTTNVRLQELSRERLPVKQLPWSGAITFGRGDGAVLISGVRKWPARTISVETQISVPNIDKGQMNLAPLDFVRFVEQSQLLVTPLVLESRLLDMGENLMGDMEDFKNWIFEMSAVSWVQTALGVAGVVLGVAGLVVGVAGLAYSMWPEKDNDGDGSPDRYDTDDDNDGIPDDKDKTPKGKIIMPPYIPEYFNQLVTVGQLSVDVAFFSQRPVVASITSTSARAQPLDIFFYYK